MQSVPFGSDTETVLRMFSASDDIIECLPSAPRRKSTKKLLGSIYDDIQVSCATVHAAKQKHGMAVHNIETRPIRSIRDIPKPNRLSMTAIPKDVIDYIHNNRGYLFQFSNRVGERTIRVYFITSHSEAATHVDTYTQYFERMMIWFHIAFKYSSDACGANIGIYIYDTPLRKSLPKHRTDIVGVSHANTAYTYACPLSQRSSPRTTRPGVGSVARESEIILFRSEEWFKVFIHETFHMLGLDFSGMPNLNAARNVVHEAFPVQSDMDIFEAYTETWATIINACFCSHFCLDNMGKVTFVSYVEVLLGFEAAWRIFQMHKILRFMGLTYSDLYSKSKKAELARANLYREDTNVFSYYVITAILLVNYGDFMEWCTTNNGVGGIMSFHKTDANTVAFANFIVRIYSTHATRKNIRDIGSNKCFNAILNANGVTDDAKWVSETMRMTVCEMC
jgi:hypothetical protein